MTLKCVYYICLPYQETSSGHYHVGLSKASASAWTLRLSVALYQCLYEWPVRIGLQCDQVIAES